MKTEIYKEEGYKLMGAAFEVHNVQGYGMAEEIYQECLEIELEMCGIPFKAKQELRCFYKGRELKKRYVPDLFVFGQELRHRFQLRHQSIEHKQVGDVAFLEFATFVEAAKLLPGLE